jgi:hypothetical protein
LTLWCKNNSTLKKVRVGFEAITTLKNHLDNAEATRRTLVLTPRCKNKNKELEFEATKPRIEFEAITTLKNHLANAEATRRTQSYKAESQNSKLQS